MGSAFILAALERVEPRQARGGPRHPPYLCGLASDAHAFFVLGSCQRPAIGCRGIATKQRENGGKRRGRSMVAREGQRAIEQHTPGVGVAQEEPDDRCAHQQQRIGIVGRHPLEQSSALLQVLGATRSRIGKHRRRAKCDMRGDRELGGIVGPQQVETFPCNGMEVGGAGAHARDHRVAKDSDGLEPVDGLDGLRRAEQKAMALGHRAAPDCNEAVQGVDVDAQLQTLCQCASCVK